MPWSTSKAIRSTNIYMIIINNNYMMNPDKTWMIAKNVKYQTKTNNPVNK